MAQIGKYRLIRKLAVGGMAEVHLAKSEGPMGFEKLLVIKRIHPSLAEDTKFVEMFLSEARIAARLNHSNITQVYDFGMDEGAYYLAMEYVDGPTLRLLISCAQEVGYEIPYNVAAKLASQACEGLHHAHEFRDPETSAWLGVVHRDVSPENILVSRFGSVKVVDFGIAKTMRATQKLVSIRGKYSYMAPEQLRGKAFDRRVDIHGLGVVLYELICGRKPHDVVGEMATMNAILRDPIVPLAKRRADVPEELARIVERCLAKDPKDRFPTCTALQTALDGFILQTGAPPSSAHIARMITQLHAIPKTQGGRAFPEEDSDPAAEPPQRTRTAPAIRMTEQETDLAPSPRRERPRPDPELTPSVPPLRRHKAAAAPPPPAARRPAEPRTGIAHALDRVARFFGLPPRGG